MIQINLQFETGAEARKALEELLGGALTVTVRSEDLAIKNEKIAENFEAPKMEIQKEEKPAEEITGKKRRTKAEIEAEGLKKLNAALDPADSEVKDAIQSDNDAAETQAQDNKEATAVTSTMLQEKAVELIRDGKKDQVVAVIKKFGGDSISQADKNALKVETYAAVMDELNKIA